MVLRVSSRQALTWLAGAWLLPIACNGRSTHGASGGGTSVAAGKAGDAAGGSGGTGAGGVGGTAGGGADDGGEAGGGTGGGGVGAAGGRAGSGMTSEPGCDYGGVHYASDESFEVDCNTCWCKAGEIACTERGCSAGSAGTGLSAGQAGTAGTGMAGASTGGSSGTGSTNQCEYPSVAAFCVEGLPSSGGGQDFVAGMALTLKLQPAGCYSSSCTKLVSSSCNYIGNDGVYAISAFICLTSEGDACTSDCGGAGQVTCDPGLTLEAGDYTVSVAPMQARVLFKVPSHVDDGALCAQITQ